MTQTQKIIKYCAIALAVFIVISIMAGIASLFGLISNVIVDEPKTTDFKNLNLNKDANVLDISIKATDLNIVVGSELKLETNNEYIKESRNNNRLTITESKHNILANKENKTLTLFVPEDFVFDVVSINNGAGDININILNAKNLFLDLGAGNVNMSNINVNREAEINGGAGDLDIKDSNINNLELDLGVGNVNLTSVLRGESEINTGVGETKINVLGKIEDYELEIDKGIGNVTVDGVSINSEYRYGHGLNHIDIDGGMGNIDVTFQK